MIQKTAQATGDLTGDKVADTIAKVLRTSPQNQTDTVKNQEENIRFHR